MLVLIDKKIDFYFRFSFETSASHLNETVYRHSIYTHVYFIK